MVDEDAAVAAVPMPIASSAPNNLHGPPPMNFDNAGREWSLWKQRFSIFMLASGRSNESNNVKIATFLHLIGEKGIELYSTLFNKGFDGEPLPGGEDEITMEEVLKRFESFCLPQKNVVMESFKFNSIVQKERQPFSEFETELRLQMRHCNFVCSNCQMAYSDRMLRDRIVLCVGDKRLQAKLLENSDDTLQQTIDKCKAAELAAANKNLLDVPHMKQDMIQYQKKRAPIKKSGYEKQCLRCGGSANGNHEKFCPALKEGAKCYKCQRLGHFANVCRSTDDQLMRYQPGQFDKGNSKFCNWLLRDYSLVLSSVLNTNFVDSINKPWCQDFAFNDVKVNFKLDTGADANCIPLLVVKKMKFDHLIRNSNTQLLSYNNTKINTFGQITLSCFDSAQKRKQNILFEVVDGDLQPILGREACSSLGLISRNGSIDSISVDGKIEAAKLIKEFDDVFEGLGKLPGTCHINLKPDSVPVLRYRKRIPESLHERLKEELQVMEKTKVISLIDYPTEWVNNLQIVEKPNGSLRLCLDPKPLNECIRREHFMIPTAESIIGRLAGMTVFTVMDLKNGFWHLELDDESADLTTFMTPFGRYRWNRVPFGLNNAPELFMRKMVQLFGDIRGVELYFDDIFISGRTIEEHNQVLRKVLQIARENGVRFNKEKLQLASEEVRFMGQQISASQVRPNKEYLEAITSLPTPENKTDVGRFLGMLKYLSQYLPNLSQRTAKLRQLTRADVDWHWSKEHDDEVLVLKKNLTEGPVLRIFDPSLPIVIQTDASKDGLGSVLMQQNQPVAYASRSLTKSEQKWAQIEKELLAVVFACERFHYFIYGREVEIQSDHKPLETLIKREIDDVSMRLQRLFLRLLKYPFITIKYVPGKNIPVADFLSRTIVKRDEEDDKELQAVIHAVRKRMCLSDQNQLKYSQATQKDETLMSIVKYLESGWPEFKKLIGEAKQYHKLRDELKFEEGLLFFGDKLVIPTSLRKEVLTMIHEPHLGIQKSLLRARPLFYWPKMAGDIEQEVKKCLVCEKYTHANPKEPLTQYEIPEYPWQSLGIDLFELAGKDYVAIIDAYSNWLVADRIKDKSMTTIIEYLESVFNRYGYPSEIRSDNSPFNSRQLAQYAEKTNIKLIFSSPGYPQSNGLAEKGVAIAKNLLKKCLDVGRPHEFCNRLLEYNASPLASMMMSPAQMFFGRRIKTKTPINSTLLLREQLPEEIIKNKLIKKRERQKLYYDRQTRPLSKLDIDNKVIFKKNSKWCYGKIVGQVNDHSFLVLDISTGQIFRRNRRHLAVTLNSKEDILDDTDDIKYSNNSSNAVPNGGLVDEAEINGGDGALCAANPGPSRSSGAELAGDAHYNRGRSTAKEPAPSSESAAGDGGFGGPQRYSSRSRRPPDRYGDWEYED